MADETEKVEYVFEGDVSSLKTATQSAIALLNKYSAALKQPSGTDSFKASQRSIASVNAALKKLSKDVSSTQTKMQGLQDVKLPTGSAAEKAIGGALSALSQQLQQLSNANKITTKDLQSFKTQLDSVRAALQSSNPQIDMLIASEQRFQGTLAKVSGAVQTFQSSMTNMRNGISNAFSPISQKLQTLQRLFDPIIAKVQSFKDSCSTAFTRTTRLSSTVADAFRRVSQDASDNESSSSAAAEAHKKLRERVAELLSTFKRETAAIDSEQSALRKKNTELKTSAKNHSSLARRISAVGSILQQEGQRLSAYAKNTRKASATSKVFAKAVQTISLTKLGQSLRGAVQSSIDFIENQNLFSVAMGKSAAQGNQFVRSMQEIYGLDPSNIYRYTGYFYQLTDAIGATRAASARMSTSLTKMALDLSSLFNVPIEEVVEDVESGMQGMTRAVRKYGMDLRATTLQQTALQYGLTESVSTLSEADRQALRFITMVQQAENALKQTETAADGTVDSMGDFARTIESPANQLKIFKEQMFQLGRAIGNFLIAPLGKVVAYINGFVMALRTAITFVSGLFGVLENSAVDIDTSGAVSGVDAIGDAAADAAEQVKELSAPFDELNVIQESKSSSTTTDTSTPTLDPALEQAIEDMSLSMDNIRMKANRVRDAILEWFGFRIDAGKIISWDSNTLEENLINKFPQWTKTIQAAFDNWSNIVEGFKRVFNSLGGVVDKVKAKLQSLFNSSGIDTSLANFISNLSTNLTKLSSWIDAHSDSIATLTLIVLGLVAAFKGLSIIANVIGTLTTFIGSATSVFSVITSIVGAITSLITAMGPVGVVIAAIAGTFLLLSTHSEECVATWREHLTPFLDALAEGITNIRTILQNLWDECIGPVVKYIGDGIERLWKKYLEPICQNVIAIALDIGRLIMNIWNNVFAPIINWLVTTFGPVFSVVFKGVWDIIEFVGDVIGNTFKTITDVFGDLIDFLNAVFSGDLKGALSAILNIFGDLGNGIINLVEDIINFVIRGINNLLDLIFGGVETLINHIGGLLEAAASVIGVDLDLSVNLTAPHIGEVSLPHIPRVALASGGVVTSPTTALIGEGRYDEAVIPLGNSPQMEDLVQRIADKVDKGNTSDEDRTIVVKVYIGQDEFDAYTYKAAERGKIKVGKQPVKVRG